MPIPKVLGQVTSCGECPHYQYNSGGTYECEKVGEIVIDKTVVAPFCPLPDYPSRIIAEMEQTIRGLRNSQPQWFGIVLMTHIATKLKLNLHADGCGVTIPFDKDRSVHLRLSWITKIDPSPLEVTFRSGDALYALQPDAKKPLLREAADSEGRGWYHHYLSV